MLARHENWQTLIQPKFEVNVKCLENEKLKLSK